MPARLRLPIRAWLLPAILMLALGGCARVHARLQPEMPPLATPPAPPHQVAPPPAPLPSAPSGPATAPSPEQPAPRTAPEKPEPAGRPRTTPAPPPEPRAGEPPKTPPPTLQTAPSRETGAEAASIRDTLAKAARDLSGVDYQRLSADAKAQYDTAQRFIRQADASLKSQNFIVARNLADKAAVLAALLHGGV